jgi:hypothetical protein
MRALCRYLLASDGTHTRHKMHPRFLKAFVRKLSREDLPGPTLLRSSALVAEEAIQSWPQVFDFFANLLPPVL